MESLYFSAFLNVFGAFVVYSRYAYLNLSSLKWVWVWVLGFALAVMLTWLVAGAIDRALITLFSGFLFALSARFFISSLKSFGVGLLACRATLLVAIFICVGQIFEDSSMSLTLRVISYFASLMMVVGMLLNTLCNVLSDLSTFTISYPRRAKALAFIDLKSQEFEPRVSVHVPCYAEPPELVVATLNAISRFEYSNFEVLVVDNNTKDPDLWQPVETHCTALGKRFRFFHVDPMSGAKAGAINFALRNTGEEARIIVVVDADYVVDPGFLRRFVPLFELESTGFIQTSHDYRDWQGNRFLRGVYYNYLLPHKTVQPALSEYGTGTLVGTVCMIKRQLLDGTGWVG